MAWRGYYTSWVSRVCTALWEAWLFCPLLTMRFMSASTRSLSWSSCKHNDDGEIMNQMHLHDKHIRAARASGDVYDASERTSARPSACAADDVTSLVKMLARDM